MTIYTSEQLARVAKVLGYAVVKWSVGYDEWQCFESGEDPVHMNDDELCMSLLRALAKDGYRPSLEAHNKSASSHEWRFSSMMTGDFANYDEDPLSAVIAGLG